MMAWYTTSTTIANTETALNRMIQRNISSGIRLLAGRDCLIFCRTVDFGAGRGASTFPKDGIEVTGLESGPIGSCVFMGSTLSDICYRSVNAAFSL